MGVVVFRSALQPDVVAFGSSVYDELGFYLTYLEGVEGYIIVQITVHDETVIGDNLNAGVMGRFHDGAGCFRIQRLYDHDVHALVDQVFTLRYLFVGIVVGVLNVQGESLFISVFLEHFDFTVPTFLGGVSDGKADYDIFDIFGFAAGLGAIG